MAYYTGIHAFSFFFLSFAITPWVFGVFSLLHFPPTELIKYTGVLILTWDAPKFVDYKLAITLNYIMLIVV